MKNIITSFFVRGTLKNNFIWSFLGNAIFLGCQWLVILVFAQLGTPLIAGSYSLALGFVMPIIATCQMQLTQLQITDIQGDHSLKDYFFFRSMSLSIGFLMILLLANISNSTDKSLMIFLFISKSFESLGEVIYGYLQSNEKFRELAFIKISRGIIIILIVVICMIVGIDLDKTVLILSLGSFLTFFFIEYKFVSERVKNDLFGKWNGFKRIFITAFPLGLSAGLNSVTTNIPKYFLNYYYGKEVVGYFSVVASPIIWAALIPNVMSQVILPKASRYIHFKKKKEYLYLMFKYTGLISLFFLMITILIHLRGKVLLSVLFGSQYAKFSDLLQILSIGLLVANLGCIGPFTVSANRSFWLQFFAVVLSFGVMLLGCLFILPNNDWIWIGWIEVVREFISILYYLIATSFIISRINRSIEKNS